MAHKNLTATNSTVQEMHFKVLNTRLRTPTQVNHVETGVFSCRLPHHGVEPPAARTGPTADESGTSLATITTFTGAWG